MANDVDQGCDQEQFIRDIELLVKKPSGPVANKICFGCDEVIGEGLRFHNADCRDLWQQRENRSAYRNFEY